jgi:1,4-alpha-glucan branching enzyme
VLSLVRKGAEPGDGPILAVCNFTPVPRHDYRVGVPYGGFWREILNSDASDYGGSGQGNFGGLTSVPESTHGRPQSLSLTIPPLAAVFFRYEG